MTGGRDWDRELAKIDRQLASMSDDQLLEQKRAPAAGAPAAAALPSPGPAVAAAKPPSRVGMWVRVGLALAVAVGVTVWPYDAQCGLPLAGYAAAVLVVAGAGAWASIATWRARAGAAHVVSMVALAWGIVLGAREILPRSGYAVDAARTTWLCR